MVWIVILISVLVLNFPVWAQEGTIAIKRTFVEKRHVDLTIEYKPADTSDEIHVFVDDVFWKAVSGKLKISVDNLSDGKHTIDLRDATQRHDVKNSCKRVTVTIPGEGLPQEGRVENC